MDENNDGEEAVGGFLDFTVGESELIENHLPEIYAIGDFIHDDEEYRSFSKICVYDVHQKQKLAFPVFPMTNTK